MIDTNPLVGYTYSRKVSLRVEMSELEILKAKEHVDPFTSEEQAKLLSVADPQFRNFLQFALWSGLRTSELIALNLERH